MICKENLMGGSSWLSVQRPRGKTHGGEVAAADRQTALFSASIGQSRLRRLPQAALIPVSGHGADQSPNAVHCDHGAVCQAADGVCCPHDHRLIQRQPHRGGMAVRRWPPQ